MNNTLKNELFNLLDLKKKKKKKKKKGLEKILDSFL